MISNKSHVVEKFWQDRRRDKGVSETNYHACSLSDPHCFDFMPKSAEQQAKSHVIGARVKRGTAHMLKDFEVTGIAPRAVGDYWVLLNDDLSPMFLVRVTEVATLPFNSVSSSWAAIEGEDSLLQWQDAHRGYYMKQCANWGIEWRDDCPVVCEAWELV